MKFKLWEKEFFLEFELTVPEEYPAKKPELKFLNHNFDKSFTMIFEGGAQQILRKLW